MLESPENFHLKTRLWVRIANRITFGRFDLIMDVLRILKHKPSRNLPEFNVDWSSKKYNRVTLIRKLISTLSNDNPTRYLEIGCAGNKLFNKVNADFKVGVDPFSGGTHQMTSDEYFFSNDKKFDVVFVDGLHEYHQVRTDVENALRCVEPGGYIVLHDMLPRNWIEAHVPCIRQGPWTGDVWKISFELAKTDGLEFCIVNIDYGVGVIKKITNTVSLYKIHELQKKEYDYYSDNRKYLPIVEYEEFITP